MSESVWMSDIRKSWLGHETMVRTVCLSIFLWISYMTGLLRGTFVSWWYLPRIWPSVTDMQLYYHVWYPTDDWNLAYMFSLVYFSVEVCLVGVYPHSVSTRRDPCARVCAHLTLKTKSNRRWPGSPLEPSEGAFERMVCLYYWVVIWVAGYLKFPLYCTVYGVCHREDTLWP